MMRLRVDVHHHFEDDEEAIELLHHLHRKIDEMSEKTQAALEAALAKIEQIDSKDDAILEYVQSIPTLIKAAVDDALADLPEDGDLDDLADAIKARVDEIGDKQDETIDAISANTGGPDDSQSGVTTEGLPSGGSDEQGNVTDAGNDANNPPVNTGQDEDHTNGA